MVRANKLIERMAKPVSPKLLIAASRAVEKHRGRNLDPMHAIALDLAKKHPADQITSAYFRLEALARFLKTAPKNAWVIKNFGKDYELVNEAMYVAAATAPLHISEDEFVFNQSELLNIALSESDIDGEA